VIHPAEKSRDPSGPGCASSHSPAGRTAQSPSTGRPVPETKACPGAARDAEAPIMCRPKRSCQAIFLNAQREIMVAPTLSLHLLSTCSHMQNIGSTCRRNQRAEFGRMLDVCTVLPTLFRSTAT
jgi:hypothetical protein